MGNSWMRALTVLWPEPGGRGKKVDIELTESEMVAIAHIRGIEKEQIMKIVRIEDGKIILPVFEAILQMDIHDLKRDIDNIERGDGGDRYSLLTILEAKELLKKLIEADAYIKIRKAEEKLLAMKSKFFQ